MTRFNTYTMQEATNKANGIKNEISFMKIFVKEIRKAITLIDKFENKVYNARFDKFIKENTLLSVGSRNNYDFTINMYDYRENGFRQSITETAVYSFGNYSYEQTPARIYNAETKLNDKFVTLFKEDNTRMNIDAWKELFESVALYVESQIKDKQPYTNAEKIYKASQKELAIQKQISDLEDKRLKAMPYFLR